MWEKVMKTFYRGLKKSWVLDVGTGTGKLVDVLVTAGVNSNQIITVEPNRELIRHFSKEHKVGCILASSDELNHWLFQGEYDLITANMVVNHMNTESYDNFVKYSHGVLMPHGYLLYTVPSPREKARKHSFNYHDNNHVVEEKAPWGGTVDYHHRSEKYQMDVLRKNGFDPLMIVWGYKDFLDKNQLKFYEREFHKKLTGIKRVMFLARKVN
jgi:cyclopropane fatty-acyl-phospholipid synthase-like methyltransferase